jgi:S1-C subfamily serine protease
LLDLLPAVPFAPVELTENERLQLGIAAGQAVFRQGNRVHPSLMASGLSAGDVVVSIGGKPIQGTSDDLLGNVRRRYLKGETVSVNVLRSGRPVELKLLLR